MPSRKTQKAKAEASKYMAFLSYSHTDNETDRGWIREAGQQLALEVGALDGDEFRIFIDVYDKEAGRWKNNHDRVLDAVPFLIPFVTPRFLKSKTCRHEVDRFSRREPKGVIIPVFYVKRPEQLGPYGRILGLLRAMDGYEWWRLRVTCCAVGSPESLREIRALAAFILRTWKPATAAPGGVLE